MATSAIWAGGRSKIPQTRPDDIISPAWSRGRSGFIPFNGATVQYCYPASDVSDGAWLNELGTNTNLYASLDETTPNDSDYVESENVPENSACEVGLGSVTDPASSAYHSLTYRVRSNGTAVQDFTVKLKEGADVIATWSHNGISSNWTTIRSTLTSEEADSITDYAALSVEFTADTP